MQYCQISIAACVLAWEHFKKNIINIMDNLYSCQRTAVLFITALHVSATEIYRRRIQPSETSVVIITKAVADFDHIVRMN